MRATGCLAVLVLGALDALNASTPREVVVYLANVSSDRQSCGETGCEWRWFSPIQRQDLLFLRLEEIPTNISWDLNFRWVFYRLGGHYYRARWATDALPQRLFRLPVDRGEQPGGSVLDVWRDPESGRWRLRTFEGFDSCTMRVLELQGKESGWSEVFSGRRQDCEHYGSVDPTERFLADTRRETLKDRLSSMRIAVRMEAAGVEFKVEGDYELPLSVSPQRTLRVPVVLGDTLHAMAPLQVVGEDFEVRIQPTGSSCLEQLGFAVEAGFLLVASEYSSDCAQIVELASGEVVRVFHSSATAAVWVPAPRTPRP